MYGIKFTHEGQPQTVQFGIVPAIAFATLSDAFERVSDDLLLYPGHEATLPIGDADPAWADLTFGVDTLLTLTIEPYREGHLLIISDAYTGSETSVGVDSLAAAFDFTVRWCGNCVRQIQAS